MSGRSETPAITEEHVSTASRPSDLCITDLRVANVTGVPFRSSIIRIDTNQGLVGYGEVRDQGSATYALTLKSRLVGENPCNVDKIFGKIKQFGFHGRQVGGVSGVEMALMDLAGKAYGVPAYAPIGGRFRDEIRCYADTPLLPDPHAMGARLADRKERGFTMLKMDVSIDLLWDVPGGADRAARCPRGPDDDASVHRHPGHREGRRPPGVLCGRRPLRRRLRHRARRRPHRPHRPRLLIRSGRALELFTLAWIEGLIPWQLTDQWRQLTAAVAVPTCTGEDIYLIDGFWPLLDAGAIRVVHPDPATVGGIAETKRLGDYAQERGVAMALHLATSTRSCCDATSTARSGVLRRDDALGRGSRATTGCGAESVRQAGPCSARHRSYSGRASSDSG
jgi:L-alanine-DL-glutamate epimerase-like enolase superfamily enzyme